MSDPTGIDGLGGVCRASDAQSRGQHSPNMMSVKQTDI